MTEGDGDTNSTITKYETWLANMINEKASGIMPSDMTVTEHEINGTTYYKVNTNDSRLDAPLSDVYCDDAIKIDGTVYSKTPINLNNVSVLLQPK